MYETPERLRAAEQFRRDGFCITPPIISADLIQRVIARMDAVIAGEYETGVPPHWRTWNPGDDENKLRKIDQSHLSDRTILELISHPAIGQWAAAITGAKFIQAWATQLLLKPPGGSESGNVGWHQDRQYWQRWWEEESEVFTAWVAISDVTADSGPMRFVRGSHRWGFLGKGDFFGTDHEAQRKEMPIPEGETWEEVPAILPPGAVSFHHRLTLHGSGPNRSSAPRRSFAIHLRTERSWPVPGSTEYYVSHLDDPLFAPVIYRAE